MIIFYICVKFFSVIYKIVYNDDVIGFFFFRVMIIYLFLVYFVVFEVCMCVYI